MLPKVFEHLLQGPFYYVNGRRKVREAIEKNENEMVQPHLMVFWPSTSLRDDIVNEKKTTKGRQKVDMTRYSPAFICFLNSPISSDSHKLKTMADKSTLL